MNKKQWKKAAIVLMGCFISMFFGMIGMTFNFLAITQNGGRMPVLADMQINTDKYFNYSVSEQVKHSLLTDRLNIRGNYFSIGDIFISMSILGFVCLFLIMLFEIMIIIKRKKPI